MQLFTHAAINAVKETDLNSGLNVDFDKVNAAFNVCQGTVRGFFHSNV